MAIPLRLLFLAGTLLLSLGTVSAANAAYTDPPGRVARLNDSRGEVSYSPAGEDEWIGAVRNRPLIRGDRLWTNRDARAEFQVGSSAIRIGSNTSIEILDLNDNIAQLQLTQGSLNLRVRRLYRGQTVEVDTPTLAFTIDHAGRYRIDVDPYDDQTTIVVWEGAGEAYGDNASFPLRTGDTVRFYDADLRDYQMYGLPREDDFDRYSLERDRRLDRSESLRYVDDDVVGYADLDEYGNWRPVHNYGTVWFPSRVSADWVPYRDGHWVWQEPWGWTWVDNAPWGFAPSHYGRWVNVSHQWGWVPGPRNVRPVYAPALVAFIGGSDWSLSISLGGDSAPIGWFPLAPREVYVPSYRASRGYFTRVNENNTVINTTTITNVYNNYSTGAINVRRVNYANRRVTGAVTAVPGTVFVNAKPVRPAAMRLDRNALATGEIRRVAMIAPSVRSVIGASETARARPSHEVFDRRVIAHNKPPAGERPFAARERQLQKNPGQALEPGAVEPAQSRDARTVRNVRVINEQRNAVDARAAGSRRAGKTTQLRPLERQAAEQQQQAERQQQQRKADSDKQQAVRQQQQRKAESDKQQAAKQQAQQLRKADGDKQQAERQQQQQRKADSDKQQAERQQQQQQRKADSDKQQAERLQQQRKAESDKQQAAKQQAQQQRKADSDKQQTERQQQQRKADSDNQQAARQQAQQQRKAASDKQQAAQQQAQRQAAEQQAAEPVGQTVKLTRAERQQLDKCEREAAQQNKDKSKCLDEVLPQQRNNNANRSKNSK